MAKIISYLFLSLALFFNINCKQNAKPDAEKDLFSEKNTNSKLNIPVNKDNPVTASSTSEAKTFSGNTKVTYPPANLLDFKDNTAWVDGSKTGGIGEWVAIYIGEGGKIKDISEIEVFILSFYGCFVNDEPGETYRDYLRPVEFKLELFVDTTLITTSNNDDKQDKEFITDLPRNLISTVKNLQSGIIWLKITILKTKISWDDYEDSRRNNNACIGDIILNIKNSNPNNVKNEISRFAKGINEKNKSIIAEFTNKPHKEVLESFTNEFDPDAKPVCDPESIRIQSENTVLVFATEGGDGGSWAKFEFKNGKWNFVETIYITSN